MRNIKTVNIAVPMNRKKVNGIEKQLDSDLKYRIGHNNDIMKFKMYPEFAPIGVSYPCLTKK